jgi:hypothetical protein
MMKKQKSVQKQFKKIKLHIPRKKVDSFEALQLSCKQSYFLS